MQKHEHIITDNEHDLLLSIKSIIICLSSKIWSDSKHWKSTQSNQSEEALEFDPALSSSNITNLHQVSLDSACQLRIALPSDALICANSMKTWNIPECCQEISKLAHFLLYGSIWSKQQCHPFHQIANP